MIDDPLAVPWFPESLHDPVLALVEPHEPYAALAELGDHWRYLLVEEVAGGVAELRSWAWPLVDQTGRLVWPDAERAQVRAVPSAELQSRLYSSRLLRRVRAGDTFAVRPPPDTAGSDEDPLGSVLGGLVLDISSDARQAAKISYFGSSAAIFPSEDAVGDLLEEAARERLGRTAVTLALEPEPPDVAPAGDVG